MPENYATMEQVVELEQKVTQLQSEMKAGFSEIQNEFKLLKQGLQIQNDERYAKQSDTFDEALLRLDNKDFRAKAMTIGNDYLETKEGKQHIKQLLCEINAEKIENATKQLTLLRLVGYALGTILTIAMIWFGVNFKDNQTTILKNQKTLYNLIETTK